LNRAVVIGSLHVDLIARADRIPGPGESVSGGTFSMAPGGKAGNQAVQLARCGIATQLLARVGDDAFGRYLVEAIHAAGVGTELVAIDPTQATGASTVIADATDYSSVICPGAGAAITATDLERARSALGDADIVILQRELPDSFVIPAIQWCKDRGALVLFNASPGVTTAATMQAIPWSAIDWLVVNDVEVALLQELSTPPSSDYGQLRGDLNVGNLVVTRGAEGSIWFGADGQQLSVAAIPARVVDTVGAGDAFLGTLAASIIRGDDVRVGLQRASAAGALAVGVSGAYDALPTATQIDAKLIAASNEFRTQ